MTSPHDAMREQAFSEMRAELRRLYGEYPKGGDPFFRVMEALDRLESRVLHRLDAVARPERPETETRGLGREALELQAKLEALGEERMDGFRERIRSGSLSGPLLRTMLLQESGIAAEAGAKAPGYDSLDAFLNGLLSPGAVPAETRKLDPDMVYYQKTPGRVVLEMVNRAAFTKEDLFYDLGSGLGQVPLLVHLLSGVTAKGVEFEPAYVRYSERAAMDLGLTGVSFIEADVRTADLSDGTVFFLYTPFTGTMLEEVLEKLRILSERKPIRIFTYGPCTLEISVMRGWVPENPEPPDAFKLRIFRSEARQVTR